MCHDGRAGALRGEHGIDWFGRCIPIGEKPYCFGLPDRSHINHREPDFGGWCDTCHWFVECQIANDKPPKILVLNLKQRYYDDIASGKKKEEFRPCNDYYLSRIKGKHFDAIEFRLGYPEREDAKRHMYFRYDGCTYTNTIWINEQEVNSGATIVIKIGERLAYPYQALEKI